MMDQNFTSPLELFGLHLLVEIILIFVLLTIVAFLLGCFCSTYWSYPGIRREYYNNFFDVLSTLNEKVNEKVFFVVKCFREPCHEKGSELKDYVETTEGTRKHEFSSTSNNIYPDLTTSAFSDRTVATAPLSFGSLYEDETNGPIPGIGSSYGTGEPTKKTELSALTKHFCQIKHKFTGSGDESHEDFLSNKSGGL